jgi:hypothetical protein
VIVLVANTGSSSPKLRVVGSSDEVLAAADLPAPGPNGDLGELERFVDGAVRPPVRVDPAQLVLGERCLVGQGLGLG